MVPKIYWSRRSGWGHFGVTFGILAKRPKRVPRWAKRVPRWSKTAQDRAKMAQDRPKTTQDRPKKVQDRPMTVQDSRKTGLRWPKKAEDDPRQT